MGYRLDVKVVGKPQLGFYGTKLYGYTEEEELKSYQWLSANKYLEPLLKDGHYIWTYYFDNPIVMHIKEFKEFAKLYNEDYNKHSPYLHEEDCFIGDPELQEILKLNDYDLVVLTWG